VYIYIYHFDATDQRKPQGHTSHTCITPTTGRYQDIAQWSRLYHDIALATMPLILRHTFKADNFDTNMRISTVSFILAIATYDSYNKWMNPTNIEES